MRRTLLFIIALLCIPALVWAWGAGVGLLGGSVPSAGSCDDCSGTLKFAWHAENVDVTKGTPCGCSDGDTTASASGSPSLSNVQKSDGTYSVLINATSEYYEFTKSGTDLLDPDDFKITFDLYVINLNSTGEEVEIITSYYDSNDYIIVMLDASYIKVYHKGNGTSDTMILNLDGYTEQWLSCEYQAKTSVEGNDHYLSCGDAGSVEEDDDHVAFNNQPTKLVIGTGGGSSSYNDGDATYYIDNIKIYPCDKY